MSADVSSGPEAAVLGQLLLMQSLLGGLPDENSIFGFVGRGLSLLPGVAGAECLSGSAGDGTANTLVFPLRGRAGTWGRLVLRLSDPAAYAPYDSYIRNFVVMLVLVLDERAHRLANARQQEELETRVRERTAQLTAEVQERRAVEEQLRRNRDVLALTLNSVPQAIFWKDRNSTYLGCNDVFARIAGLASPAEVPGKRDADLPWRAEDAAKYVADDRAVVESGQPKRGLVEPLRCADGRMLWIETTKVPLLDAEGQVYAVLGVFDDVTEKRRAAEERESLQQQLAQAQKMESVGRLAGGVAHDFNNMLQAILGNASIALAEPQLPAKLREHLEEILRAGERSAGLTQQLLAFARKQTVTPRVLDLNKAVEAMLKMLHRLIGEDIALNWRPAPDLPPICIDPVQIDQVLANLVVNARDAIRGGGRIEIATRAATLTTGMREAGLDLPAGHYATLTIADSGCGMSAETRAHLFEPFFTTKPLGQGTGLGLATVYGIVKQNQGAITVQSEPGRGTAFTLWFPRTQAVAPSTLAPKAPRPTRGSETILLVEDESQILMLAQLILQQQGYRVLAASLPQEAIRLAEAHPGPIHLLITDVIMPGMNGRELRDRIAALKPGLRCLFISGYTADVLAAGGGNTPGVDFQQKPFTPPELTERVRRVLDGPAPPRGA
jgi:PAS domain S-box-containing protein